VRAASGGQGLPRSGCPERGRLYRRLIRRATLACLRLQRRVSIPTGLPVPHLRLPAASPTAPVFSAPDLSEGARRGGYRDACPIARSLRGLLDACSIPRPRAPHPQMGRATVRRCRPTTRRQSSTAAFRTAARRPVPEADRRADRARQGRAWQSEGTAKEPPLCHYTQLGDSCVGKVAAGGRATRPTNPGRTCDVRQVLVASSRVQVRRTPVVPLDRHWSEDYRTARCSIARNSDRRLCMTTLLGRPF